MFRDWPFVFLIPLNLYLLLNLFYSESGLKNYSRIHNNHIELTTINKSLNAQLKDLENKINIVTSGNMQSYYREYLYKKYKPHLRENETLYIIKEDIR